MLDLSYTLLAAERKEMLKIIEELKTPINYMSPLHKKVSEGKLRYMNWHDFHVLIKVVILGIRRLMGGCSGRAVLLITLSANRANWTYSLNIL
jgi:hypothetical protein